MSERYKVFFAEETPFVEVFLRRFRFSADAAGGCRCDETNATPLCRVEWPVRSYLDGDVSGTDRGHSLWPKACNDCGRPFVDSDEWQANMCRVYRRADTGEKLPVVRHVGDLPVGAVVDAWWDGRKGADGRSLVVVTPQGDWNLDHRASNCTRPDDKVHRCWVRHGRPEDGTLHVDKAGDTCAAGAGSIIMHGGWHGFLHHGELYRC
ncbi:MAG TPA: hypothetical protein VGI79_20845 [Caulobacteraceae bacterium]|jgi:hypothetical protein